MGWTKKRSAVAKLIVALVIILALLYSVFFGLTIGGKLIIPAALDKTNGIRQGLDLTGGSVIVYQANVSGTPTADEMNGAIAKIRARLGYSYSEATVTQQGSNQIRVEIPSVSNPEEAESMLGSTGKITFVDYQGNVLMEGSSDYISKAQYVFTTPSGGSANQNCVQLTFTSAGQAAFKAATQQVLTYPDTVDSTSGISERAMIIMLDNNIISAPTVSTVIDSSTALITYGSQSTPTQVKSDADVINSGTLPFDLTVVQSQSIGATLGDKALSSSLLAGLIGVILIILFMIFLYRLPGIMASISLLAYIGLVLLIMTLLHANLTLAGIGGLILSIGMAVDANIIIFERVKEEMAMGKSVSTAVHAGFKHAFTAILDSNVNTLLAVLALYWKGTGTIQAFAITLGLGVIVSLFTAITLTRFFLNQMVKLEVHNPKFYAHIKGLEGGEVNV